PVARTGDPAPGTTGMFSFLDQPVGNAAGTLLVRATTTTSGPGSPSLWSVSGTAISPLAVAGSPAPGTAAGTVFAEGALQPSITTGDRVAFWARLTGGGANPGDDTGIWGGP